jgi:ribose transport system permease protein
MTVNLSSLLRQMVRHQWVILLLVVIVIALFTGANNERFFREQNIRNIFEQISVLGLVAAGATILIISGNFDISVASQIGLSTCITAMLIIAGWNEALAAGVGVLVCIACSLLNGILSLIFKAPSFIVSLATIGIYHGLALYLTKGVIQTIYGQFEFIARTRLFDVIPLLFVFSLAGYVFVHIILTYTQLGRRVFAIGSNRRAAYLSGINVNLNTLIFFALSGALVGLAGVLLLSRVGSATPSTGQGLELSAIGAVVIGGVPIIGGKGNVVGTFLGVLLLGVISNSLNILRVDPFLQEISFGVLILLALGISSLRLRVSR